MFESLFVFRNLTTKQTSNCEENSKAAWRTCEYIYFMIEGWSVYIRTNLAGYFIIYISVLTITLNYATPKVNLLQYFIPKSISKAKNLPLPA